MYRYSNKQTDQQKHIETLHGLLDRKPLQLGNTLCDEDIEFWRKIDKEIEVKKNWHGCPLKQQLKQKQ